MYKKDEIKPPLISHNTYNEELNDSKDNQIISDGHNYFRSLWNKVRIIPFIIIQYFLSSI